MWFPGVLPGVVCIGVREGPAPGKTPGLWYYLLWCDAGRPCQRLDLSLVYGPASEGSQAVP
eukprot:5164264-Pyramimonas_sp.AAC.1